MDSSYWQIISVVFLIIGILLLLFAAYLAARYKVVGNIVSEIKAKKHTSEPITEFHSADMVRRSSMPETVVDNVKETFYDDNITTVVGKTKTDTVNDTVVVSRNSSADSDFRIIRNIILINADPDVIDEHRGGK